MEKVDKILKTYYNQYEEENRFKKSNHNRLEFITTTKYIEKYLKKEDKILEVGAGTGAYSLYYAKQGYDVTAIELVEENLTKLKQGIEETMNIQVHQGNAVDLSLFADETFDMTLVLGPMYHLFTREEQEKAIAEAIRVTKRGGLIYFAYITNDAVVLRALLMEHKLLEYREKHDKEFKLDNSPEEVFYLFLIKDFEELMKDTNTICLHEVATDGIAQAMQMYIDHLSEAEFEEWIKYHLATCERKDLMGYSSHVLHICQKNKYIKEEFLCKQLYQRN